MSHRCGFTLNVLLATLEDAGFAKVVGTCRPQYFDLWALASLAPVNDEQLKAHASEYFPQQGDVVKNINHIEDELQNAVDEVLVIAKEHQDAGRLEEAEQLYLEIINIQPRHAEANYNLGLIEANLKGAIVSLPRLEIAVEMNPANEQFWVTYVDALMQSGVTSSILAVLELGQQHGLKAETAQILAAEFAAMKG